MVPVCWVNVPAFVSPQESNKTSQVKCGSGKSLSCPRPIRETPRKAHLGPVTAGGPKRPREKQTNNQKEQVFSTSGKIFVCKFGRSVLLEANVTLGEGSCWLPRLGMVPAAVVREWRGIFLRAQCTRCEQTRGQVCGPPGRLRSWARLFLTCALRRGERPQRKGCNRWPADLLARAFRAARTTLTIS